MRSVGLFPLDVNGDPNGPLSNYAPSLTLGGAGVHILDEAHGLATIADMGVYHDIESILTVKDAHGKLLYQSNPDASRRQAIDPGVAFVAAQVLSDNYNRRTLFGLNSQLHWPDRTVAAKTGTGEDFKDDASLAFTPDLYACGVMLFELLTGERPTGTEVPSEPIPFASDHSPRTAPATAAGTYHGLRCE